MKRLRLLSGLCALLWATAAVAVPAEKDTDRVVRLTVQLETEPSGFAAEEARRWLVKWVQETPDYTVKVCDIMGPIPGMPTPNSSVLLGQMVFGNVSFQIQQGRGTDEASRQVAGFRSLLRVYALLLSADPAARIPYMDPFLEAEKKGQLRAKLAPVLAAKACD